MSASLSFRICTPPPSQSIGWILHPLRKKFDLDRGPHILKESDIPYLKGLHDGVIRDEERKDCNRLIRAIQQHGEIEIFLSY